MGNRKHKVVRRKKKPVARKLAKKRVRILLTTEGQLSILKVLWVEGECTVAEIRDVLSPEDRSFGTYTQIAKMLVNLESSGLVVVRRVHAPNEMIGLKKTNLYKAVFTKDELLAKQIESIREWFINPFEIGGLQ